MRLFETWSDAELLAGTAQDPAAFGAWYRRHEREVLSFFRYATRSSELAADLTAETFAAALESIGGHRAERGEARAWLFGIARHVLARSLERGRVRPGAATPGGVRPMPGRGRRIRGFGVLAVGCAVAAAVVLVFAGVATRRPAAPHPRTVGHPPAGTIDPSVPATYSRACATTFDCLSVPPGPVPAALRMPFRLPRLAPGQRCPTTAGTSFDNSELGRGIGLGTRPVRADIGNGGDREHGRIVLGTTEDPGWYGIKTVWFSLSSYRGPWSVRAARLSGSGRIDLGSEPAPHPKPAGSRFSPAAVGAAPGDTINTGGGVRTDPRTTWITAPGCYAFEVAGVGFNELIVFQALAPGSISGRP